MCVTFDVLRGVASLEEMAPAAVVAIESARIDAVQNVHPCGEICLSQFDDQVIVIAHQAVGKAAPTVTGHDAVEKLEELIAVPRSRVDLASVVAAARHVKALAGRLVAEWTRHSGSR